MCFRRRRHPLREMASRAAAILLLGLALAVPAAGDGDSFAISHMNDGRKIQRNVIEAGVTR